MPRTDEQRALARQPAAAVSGCGGCAKRREWLRRQASQTIGRQSWLALACAITLLVTVSLAGKAWAQSAPAALPQVADGPQAPQAASASPPTDENVETIAPDTRRELLIKFQAQYPQAREHVLNLPMNAYANTSETPGLRLKRMWVGEGATLLEIEGLPVPGQQASAVIRQDNFELVGDKGQRAALQAAEGVTQLKDRRGGSALVVKPGETLLALFGPVNDARPVRLQHTPRAGQVFVYFDNIDPRFRERYTAAYRAAAAPGANPEAMRDFLVEFAQNDPDGKSPEIFLKLVNAMRAQNTFEGYYNVYLLLQDPEDARKASQLARTDEHRAKLEHMAVATLVDKNRLVDFDLHLTNANTTTSEGSCWMRCRYNFSAMRQVRGELSVSVRRNSPVPLKLGRYKVTLQAVTTLPRRKIRSSSWLGNYDGPDNATINNDLVVTLAPPNYSVKLPVNVAHLQLAFFERGSAGGYEGSWATSDATVRLQIKSVELLP